MQPLLQVRGLQKHYGNIVACRDISFDLWPGEVLAIVGESGSGKTTLIECLCGLRSANKGQVFYQTRNDGLRDILAISEPERRYLIRTDWGFVHQNPRDGLRLNVTAGGNIGERLMAVGERHYGRIRQKALHWMNEVEIANDRIDGRPKQFSGGMQQRLQIARNLVSEPRLVLMDEPTGGLDVSVQARLIDLLRRLVRSLHLSLIIVTHDLAVARLLAHRMIVMQSGSIV